METATATVDARGRTVVPASIRRAAGIGEDQEIVYIAEGRGRVLLTTREAVQAEVWAAAPIAEGDEPDAGTDVRIMRREDGARSEEAAIKAARRGAGDPEVDATGAALLHDLGLAYERKAS